MSCAPITKPNCLNEIMSLTRFKYVPGIPDGRCCRAAYCSRVSSFRISGTVRVGTSSHRHAVRNDQLPALNTRKRNLGAACRQTTAPVSRLRLHPLLWIGRKTRKHTNISVVDNWTLLITSTGMDWTSNKKIREVIQKTDSQVLYIAQ